jgi:hypothetical protein
MKRLTKTEERAILNDLMISGNFIANGSSRAVFDFNDNLVIKIAIDRPGQRQNANEIQAYKIYGKDSPLAKIVSYGKNIIVMEKVNPLDYDEVEGIISGYYRDDYDYNEDEEYEEPYPDGEFIEAVRNTVRALERINGETDDNFQIGYDSNGRLVAYDYGYESGGFPYLVSRSMDRFINNTRSWEEFLGYITERLSGSHKNTRRITRIQIKEIERLARW